MATLPWTPKDIMLALKVRGWTQRRLAEELNMSPGAVAYALRTGSSLPLREKVQEILAEKAVNLWPNRYPPQWRECAPS